MIFLQLPVFRQGKIASGEIFNGQSIPIQDSGPSASPKLERAMNWPDRSRARLLWRRYHPQTVQSRLLGAKRPRQHANPTENLPRPTAPLRAIEYCADARRQIGPTRHPPETALSVDDNCRASPTS